MVARDLLEKLPGGDLNAQSQDEVIKMLEQWRDSKRHDFDSFLRCILHAYRARQGATANTFYEAVVVAVKLVLDTRCRYSRTTLCESRYTGGSVC